MNYVFLQIYKMTNYLNNCSLCKFTKIKILQIRVDFNDQYVFEWYGQAYGATGWAYEATVYC